jgi:hypothetical protein
MAAQQRAGFYFFLFGLADAASRLPNLARASELSVLSS